MEAAHSRPGERGMSLQDMYARFPDEEAGLRNVFNSPFPADMWSPNAMVQRNGLREAPAGRWFTAGAGTRSSFTMILSSSIQTGRSALGSIRLHLAALDHRPVYGEPGDTVHVRLERPRRIYIPRSQYRKTTRFLCMSVARSVQAIRKTPTVAGA